MDSTDKLYHSSFSVGGHFIYVHQLQIPIHKVFSRKFGEHQVYTGTVVDPLYVTLLVDSYIFTGRNEVVAKVMFLHVCVILFTGGGSPGRPPGTWQGEPPPPGPGRESPPGTWQGEPPQTRQEEMPHPPGTWQGEPPGPGREEPPRTRQGEPPWDLAGRTPPGPGRENPHPPGTWQGEPPTPTSGPGRENPPPGPGREELPPWTRQTPRDVDCRIRSMSGRYASYWNAFLLNIYLLEILTSIDKQTNLYNKPKRPMLKTHKWKAYLTYLAKHGYIVVNLKLP